MFWDENIVRSFLKIFELRAWSHFLNILRKKNNFFHLQQAFPLWVRPVPPRPEERPMSLNFHRCQIVICHMPYAYAYAILPYCHDRNGGGNQCKDRKKESGIYLHCHDYRDDHHDRHHDHHDDRHNLSVRIARGLRRRGRSSSTWTVRPRTWQSQMILMKSFREIIMNMVTRSCSDPDYIENMNLTSAFRSLYQSSDCTPTIGPWWDIFARN